MRLIEGCTLKGNGLVRECWEVEDFDVWDLFDVETKNVSIENSKLKQLE